MAICGYCGNRYNGVLGCNCRDQSQSRNKVINMQTTSLQAYDSILSKLGAKQKVVYDKMIEIGRPVTHKQLAEYLGWSINRVTGRVYELVKAEVVKEACKVKNEYKRDVIAWAPIKGRQLTFC